MKNLGLIGGMSWESSAEYYRLLNEEVRTRLGGLHSADCIMRSIDFAPMEKLQREGRWAEAGRFLAREAALLESSGADILVLCTNTMHKVAEIVETAISVPFLHIADATATAVTAHGIETVGLLATAYTMEEDFYRGRLADRFGLNVLTPDESDRRVVHDIIYQELCAGIVSAPSRDEYRRIMAGLVDSGAEAIVLGCTEITLLIGPDDATVPIFDTTRLHVMRAIDLALS